MHTDPDLKFLTELDFNSILKDRENTVNDKSFLGTNTPTPYDIHHIESNYWDTSNFAEQVMGSEEGISFIHLNVQCLPAKYENFQSFVSAATHDQTPPSLLALSETWLNSHNKSNYNLAGYYPFISYCRNDDIPHGGVGFFVRKDIEFIERPELTTFIPFVFESLVITLTSLNITVVVIYRTTNVQEFFLHSSKSITHMFLYSFL